MDLDKKLQLILDSELSAYRQKGRISGGLGSFNVNLQSVPNAGWTARDSVTKYLFDEVDKDFIKSDNAELILKLYSSVGAIEREKLEQLLLNYLDKDDEHNDISYLIVFVFIRIGKLRVAIDKAFKDLKGDDNNAYSNVIHMLKIVVSREYTFFSLEELSDIKDMLNNDKEAMLALLPTLREACKRLVGQELNNQENIEIVVDTNNLITFFNINFPGGDVSNQIKHIEELFKQGDFNQQSYATCVDRVRVLLVEAAKYLAVKNGLKNPEKKEDKEISNFLHVNGHITDEEYQLLISFYSLCSNNGSHISKTDRNTARLVKNMGFEIVALLSSYSENAS
mgnify:CR=1 FL=1